MSADHPYASVVRALDELTIELEEQAIAQRGVDLAQAATGSRIAYLHFLNEDQNSIELGVWSRDTLATCSAVYDRHYPVRAAGIWADSARQRAPCIHNDYATASGRGGLPEGHSPLLRHLGVPVVEGDRVRLLVGVGNKPEDYDATDVALLDLIARRVWSLIRQRRLLEGYLDLGQRFRHVQEIASITGCHYDVDEDALAFDGLFAAIFQVGHPTEMPTSLHQLLRFVAPADHERVRAAFSGRGHRRQVLRIRCLRAGGSHFPAELKLEFRPREVGRGVIGVGILQDVSEQVAVEDLRARADTDPLTGLPNRNRLQEVFRQGCGRRGHADRVAFHYIDLDGFKPVNDLLGHPVGDEVLRIVGRRLCEVVRQSDLVVRMGGDEFAVVQTGVDDAAAVSTLADKIVAAVGQPMTALGHCVAVGASVGIAICPARDCTLAGISAAADRALYRAKAAGGRCHVLETGADCAR